MDTSTSTRRRLLAGAAAFGGVAALSPRAARAQAPIRLRSYWWGAKDRADRTNKVDEMFSQAHPEITIVGETIGWGDYWTRLATQAAGRNMADLVQMDFGYIFEYARRKALLPLDGLIGKQIDLSGFTPESIDGGKVDGKVYGVSLGLNSTALVYDRDAFGKYGVAAPDWPMTWDEFGRRAAELTKAAGRDGFWASSDSGVSGPALDVWLRERGKTMYAPDGRFGADMADMADWFGYWETMRTRGSCVPPDVQALDKGDIDTSMLTLGKSAVAFANSNQLVGYQALNKNRLEIAMYPAGRIGEKSGQYLKPSQMWSIAATSRNPDAAARLLSYFVADAAAGKVLGVERGIPASKAVREAIAPDLDDMSKRLTGYIDFVSDKVSPLPPPPPRGAGEVLALLVRTNETIGFKRMSVADGAKQFIRECEAILSRA